MNHQFKYVSEQDFRAIDGISRALDILSGERILIDAAYLPALELAERGEYLAWFEMQEAFALGTQGVPKHYGLARRYTEMIKEFIAGSPKALVETYFNSACLENGCGHPEIAKLELIKAVQTMSQNLLPEEWDFRVFDLLQLILDKGEDYRTD